MQRNSRISCSMVHILKQVILFPADVSTYKPLEDWSTFGQYRLDD
jgi:hypothetical protein